MNSSFKLSKGAQYFCISYLIFLLAATLLLPFFEKGELLRIINSFHSSSLDIFFKYMTYYGDGIMYGIIIFIAGWVSYYHFLSISAMCLLQTLLIQGLKRGVFKHIHRPSKFFEDFDTFHLVEGVRIKGHFSFPSGHTATAYTISLFIALYFIKKHPKLGVLLLFLAVLGGTSRMYLLQHFLIDTYAGSIFGVASALIIHFAFQKYNLDKNTQLTDRSFKDLFRR